MHALAHTHTHSTQSHTPIHHLHCPFSVAPHSRALSRQEAPRESGSLLGLETPLGTSPAHRACWPGHPNSHPLTVLSSRLRPTPQLKCETTAGRQPRGLGFHHTQLPTPRPEARVRWGCWPKAWAGRWSRGWIPAPLQLQLPMHPRVPSLSWASVSLHSVGQDSAGLEQMPRVQGRQPSETTALKEMLELPCPVQWPLATCGYLNLN